MTTDYAAMWQTYQHLIYAYIYRRTSDQLLSEDLTGQTFLKIIEACEAGKGPKSSESGWVYRIAHNLVIDHYRARDRHPIADLEDSLPVQGRSPLELAEIKADMALVDAAMRRLTDEQAQVIQLRYIEGYAFGEIAAVMDKTEGAVKALQHRGLGTLRQLLSREMMSA